MRAIDAKISDAIPRPLPRGDLFPKNRRVCAANSKIQKRGLTPARIEPYNEGCSGSPLAPANSHGLNVVNGDGGTRDESPLGWAIRRSGGRVQGNYPDGARTHADGTGPGKLPRSCTHRMKPKFALLAALVAGFSPWPRLPRRRLPQLNRCTSRDLRPGRTRTSRSRSGRSAGAAGPRFVPPSAFPARIAIITFQRPSRHQRRPAGDGGDAGRSTSRSRTQLEALATEIER